jgi:hypothetical protein
LQGDEMKQLMSGFLCAPTERKARPSNLRPHRFLRKPEELCVVLMQAPRVATHVGIWIRGRVLHIIANKGVQYQPLDVVRVGFSKVRFFTCA